MIEDIPDENTTTKSEDSANVLCRQVKPSTLSYPEVVAGLVQNPRVLETLVREARPSPSDIWYDTLLADVVQAYRDALHTHGIYQSMNIKPPQNISDSVQKIETAMEILLKHHPNIPGLAELCMSFLNHSWRLSTTRLLLKYKSHLGSQQVLVALLGGLSKNFLLTADLHEVVNLLLKHISPYFPQESVFQALGERVHHTHLLDDHEIQVLLRLLLRARSIATNSPHCLQQAIAKLLTNIALEHGDPMVCRNTIVTLLDKEACLDDEDIKTAAGLCVRQVAIDSSASSDLLIPLMKSRLFWQADAEVLRWATLLLNASFPEVSQALGLSEQDSPPTGTVLRDTLVRGVVMVSLRHPRLRSWVYFDLCDTDVVREHGGHLQILRAALDVAMPALQSSDETLSENGHTLAQQVLDLRIFGEALNGTGVDSLWAQRMLLLYLWHTSSEIPQALDRTEILAADTEDELHALVRHVLCTCVSPTTWKQILRVKVWRERALLPSAADILGTGLQIALQQQNADMVEMILSSASRDDMASVLNNLMSSETRLLLFDQLITALRSDMYLSMDILVVIARLVNTLQTRWTSVTKAGLASRARQLSSELKALILHRIRVVVEQHMRYPS